MGINGQPTGPERFSEPDTHGMQDVLRALDSDIAAAWDSPHKETKPGEQLPNTAETISDYFPEEWEEEQAPKR